MQKYTSQWIDPTYVLVFTVYLRMSQIFRDFTTGSKQKWQKSHGHCLHPVGKSVHMRGIPQIYCKNYNIGEIYPL